MKCRHPESVLSTVTFKNNTQHIQMNCAECGQYQGYLAHGLVDLSDVPGGKTEREILIDQGIEVVDGCFYCGGEHRGVDGFCGGCRRIPEARFIKSKVKESGKSIFTVSKPTLYEWLTEFAEGR